jgi:hypothetical protein
MEVFFPKFRSLKRQKLRFGLILYALGIATGFLVSMLVGPTQATQVAWPTQAPQVTQVTHEAFLEALWEVEASGSLTPPDGDDGKAIGPYQIHLAYWQDAVAKVGSGVYQDCRDKMYAEKIISAYMGRYCPQAWEEGDWATIARTHNGGPRGPLKTSTKKYWKKVKAQLY